MYQFRSEFRNQKSRNLEIAYFSIYKSRARWKWKINRKPRICFIFWKKSRHSKKKIFTINLYQFRSEFRNQKFWNLEIAYFSMYKSKTRWKRKINRKPRIRFIFWKKSRHSKFWVKKKFLQSICINFNPNSEIRNLEMLKLHIFRYINREHDRSGKLIAYPLYFLKKITTF